MGRPAARSLQLSWQRCARGSSSGLSESDALSLGSSHTGSRTTSASKGRAADDSCAKCAVLIAGKTSPQLIDLFFGSITLSSLGKPVDKRLYLNIDSPLAAEWNASALEHGIELRALPHSPSVALALDAMDIVDSAHQINTFVLASEDAALAPLAQRLRRGGKRVVLVTTACGADFIEGPKAAAAPLAPWVDTVISFDKYAVKCVDDAISFGHRYHPCSPKSPN